MRKFALIILAVAGIFLSTSCNKKKDYSEVKLKSELDSVSFYLGVFWGKNAEGGGVKGTQL